MPVQQSGSAGQSSMGTSDVPVMVSNVAGSFAWHVLYERNPVLVKQTRDSHPYGPEQRRALDLLGEEIVSGPMRPMPRDAHDRAAWDHWGADYYGEPWADAPYLWSESYFYRRLLEAVEFFNPGPWYRHDPFEHLKTAELHDPTLDAHLAGLDNLAELPTREKTEALLLASLWGNRADLGFRIGMATTGQQQAQHTRLVADDTDAVASALDSGAASTICVVADNAGRELLSDLLLIDHLLDSGLAARVVLHVKPSPYYVSDATTSDFVQCLRRLASVPGAASEAAHRLQQATGDGRVALHAHEFYCAPLPLHDMPADLADEFADASMIILKGDLNYRRLVGDYHWPPTTAFADTEAYFPGRVVALRTLKSEAVVGIESTIVTDLDSTDQPWRTNGTYGLVQARI